MLTGNARVTAAVLAVLLAGVSVCSAKVIYVDGSATGVNNGSSWADAYRYLQDALADANEGDEIRIAQGVYRPDRGEGITAGDRGAIFALKGGVTTRGGYAGYGSPDPNARNINRHKTILSGDLAGNDVAVADPCDLLTEPSRSENSEHILTVGGGTPVLDGFTVTSANCTYSGGGIVMGEADLVVTDCVFTANSAGYSGGAMTGWNSRVVFERCQFIGNAATGNGGAVFMDTCTCRDGYLACVDCKFINNSAGQNGGAIHIADSTYMLTSLMNCLITGNKAGSHGAALNAYSADGSWLVNCTLSGNWAKSEGPCPYQYGGASLINCILRYNQGSTICPAPSYLYTFTEGASGEPYFVSPGYWDADELWVDGDYHLQPASPCINAGDPEFISEPADPVIPVPGEDYIRDPEPYIIRSSDRDLDGWPRVIGGRVDMGAYEYQGPKIIYVDADATGANDGSSWPDAFRYLQDALRAATGRDRILVAEGVYKPDQGIYQPPCERTATFQLISGVAIRGGYAGFGQPDPNARDIELYETILSGDLRGNDAEFDDSEWHGIVDFTSDPNRAENSYSVVTGSGTDSTAVIDGFTITGGNANGPILGRCPDIDYRLAAGAGMYNACGSPTVLNCTFRRNTTRSPYGCSGSGCPAEADAQALAAAGGFYCSCASFSTYLPATCGAGMFNCSGSPTLHNCRFEENISFGADGFSAGGGMFNLDSNPVLVNCTFRRNLVTGFDSEYYGGAVYDHSSTSTFTNCSFINNDSHQGGALYSTHNSSAMLTGCLFVGNSAQHGGGVIFSSAVHLIVVSCTFAGNRTPYGNNIECDPWQTNSLKAINCILWNGGNEVSSGCSDAQIDFSDIQGGWEGEGDINVDPCFAQPGRWDDNGTPDTHHDDFWVDGDYHLKSQAGRWNESEGLWTKDEVTSPCIDAGDPLGPIGLEPFPNGGIVNMGAYGGTAEASKSYFGRPPCETIVAGDINGDCEIDFRDFFFVALHWLEDINQ